MIGNKCSDKKSAKKTIDDKKIKETKDRQDLEEQEMQVREYIPCPVEVTLSIISGKWKGIILYRLLDKTMRFNELKKTMPNITCRTLTLQLRQLEEDGIIKRTVFPQVPPRVDYELTPLGKSMSPIIQSIRSWGIDYQKNVLHQMVN